MVYQFIYRRYSHNIFNVLVTNFYHNKLSFSSKCIVSQHRKNLDVKEFSLFSFIPFITPFP